MPPSRDQRYSVGLAEFGQRDAGQHREQRLGHLGRSFLVCEQARALDHLEPRVGERVDHLARPRDGEERIPVAPDELHGDGDPAVDVGELAHVAGVEAPEQLHRGVLVLARVVDRSEEELVELAVEQSASANASPSTNGLRRSRRCPITQPSVRPRPGMCRTDRNDLNRQLRPCGCSVLMSPIARTRGSPAARAGRSSRRCRVRPPRRRRAP